MLKTCHVLSTSAESVVESVDWFRSKLGAKIFLIVNMIQGVKQDILSTVLYINFCAPLVSWIQHISHCIKF